MGAELDRAVALDAIEHRRVDAQIRDVMEHGLELTWEELDRIGESGVQWLRDRCGLTAEITDEYGMQFAPESE